MDKTVTMAGTLHIITTPFPTEASDVSTIRRILANADDIVCCDERHGAMMLHSIDIASPVTGLDPRLPVAEVAAIVQALHNGRMIAVLLRTDHASDVATITELAAICRSEGLSVLPEQEEPMPTRRTQPTDEQTTPAKKRRTSKKTDGSETTLASNPPEMSPAEVPIAADAKPKRRTRKAVAASVPESIAEPIAESVAEPAPVKPKRRSRTAAADTSGVETATTESVEAPEAQQAVDRPKRTRRTSKPANVAEPVTDTPTAMSHDESHTASDAVSDHADAVPQASSHVESTGTDTSPAEGGQRTRGDRPHGDRGRGRDDRRGRRGHDGQHGRDQRPDRREQQPREAGRREQQPRDAGRREQQPRDAGRREEQPRSRRDRHDRRDGRRAPWGDHRDRRDQQRPQQEQREQQPRQQPSYDEQQPMSNETMFGYQTPKRRDARRGGSPQFNDQQQRRGGRDDRRGDRDDRRDGRADRRGGRDERRGADARRGGDGWDRNGGQQRRPQGPRPQGQRPQGPRPQGQRPQGQPQGVSYDEVQPRTSDGMVPARRGPAQRGGGGARGGQRGAPQGGRGGRAGGRNQGPRGKGRGKAKGLGMVSKKRDDRTESRSKVYTSQMFLYKENLDERKPTERTLRTRRKKSSDD